MAKRKSIDSIENLVEISNNKKRRTFRTNESIINEDGIDDDSTFIETQSDPELKDKITEILNGSHDVIIISITNLFKSTINETNNQSKKHVSQLFMDVFAFLIDHKNNADPKIVSSLTCILVSQINILPFNMLKKLTDTFLIRMKEQKAFNEKVLPLYIELFKYIQAISPKWETEDTQSGNAYIESKIEKLLEYTFTQQTAINIIYTFKNIKLNNEQLKRLINKLLDLQEIKWSSNQIPSLIHNLLHFTCLKEHRLFIYEAILLFFDNLRRVSISNTKSTQKVDMIDSETLAIMHIIHSIKTDRSAARDLLKLFKTKLIKNVKQLIQPFTYALMISLIKVLPKQDGVLDVLKQTIVKIFDAELQCKKYTWIGKCLNDEEKNLIQQLEKPSKCKILSTDFIINGFIEFLFYLLDSNGVRMMSKSMMRPITLDDHVTFYASAVLNDLFKHYSISREEILNSILERIITLTSFKSIVFIDQLNILIKVEHASFFQEYFRKFKGKLDHMINLTPLIALELIKAIKPLFRYDSVYKDNLIIILKKSIHQSDTRVRTVGVCGLVSLLTTTRLSTFLPASQASQSMSLSQSQSQVSRLIKGSQEKNSEKNCLEIFLSLRRCLTQQATIRSRLYQSCLYLISQNTTLVGPVLNLLLTKLDEYLIKGDEGDIVEYDGNGRMHFDLAKLMRLSNNEIEHVEPLDILLHATFLCNMKFMELDLSSRMSDLDEDIKKHSDDLRAYFDLLKDTILQTDTNTLFEFYKNQLDIIIQKNQQATNFIQISPKESNNSQSNNGVYDAYQCLLGSIEVLMENYVYTNDYDTAVCLFKKFKDLQTLIEKSLSSSMAVSSTGKTKKTKVSNKKAKKTSKNQEEKENDGTTVSGCDIETTINDVIDEMVDNQEELTKESTSKISNKKQKSASAWSYTHRLSYTTTLKLGNIIFNKSIESKTENFQFYLNSSDNLLNYLMHVITQQLNSLKESTQRTVFVYDCEMYDDAKLWKYLFSLWKLLWLQMNNSKCLYSECSLDDTLYCCKCIASKINYIKCLCDIWNIISSKYSAKVEDLFSIDVFNETNDDLCQSNASNISVVAVGLTDNCRKYIEKCLNSPKDYVSKAYQLSSLVLDLMQDICKSIQLQLNDFAVLFQWTQSLATQDCANDTLFSKSLLKFFVYVTWNKNSSAALVKYLCTDVVHYFGQSTHTNEDEIDSAFFNFLSDSSLNQIMQLIFDEQKNILCLFEWLLLFKSTFDNIQQITTFYKQVNCLMQSLNLLLQSDIPLGIHQENLMRILIKFYQFMIILCKHVNNRDLLDSEEVLLKQLVDFNAKRLQNLLQKLITSIQNVKPSANKKDQTKNIKSKSNANDMTTTKIIKCTKQIPQLVYVVEEYEQQLKILDKKLKNLNLLENCVTFIRDFKISLSEISTQTQESTLNTQSSILSREANRSLEQISNEDDEGTKSTHDSEYQSAEETEDVEDV